MKNIYRAISVFLLIVSFYGKTWSAHIIGGEMTYVCEGEDPANPGSNIYTVTMKVYRDCQGGGANFDSAPGAFTQASISVFEGNSPVPFIPAIYLDPPIETTIDPDAGNPCLIIPPNVCVEEGVYTFTVSLPISTESYHLVYQRCCRNNTISNIINPGESGATYTVELTPMAQAECNISPVFNDFPPVVICVNEPLVFDHSAFDADGDQLVYEFCSPLLGGSINNVAPDPDGAPPFDDVTFVLPEFNALNPLAGSPVVTIDPLTGIISGTPDIQGQLVVGICVKEFRNGELLSVIQRDFQFNVTYCEPTVHAVLDGVNADGIYEFHSCVDSTISIVNESTDEQFIQEYLWEFDIPDNLPLTFDTRDITVTFPGPGFYTGTMILNPGFDCSDTSLIEVTISPPINADFEFDYDTCVAGPVDFTDLTVLGDAVIEEWLWNFGDTETSAEPNPSHQYEEPGVHTVTLLVTDEIGCTDIVTHQVNWYPVPPVIIIEPTSFVGCPPAEITFENLSTPIDETYDIFWDFGDGGTATDISPIYTFETPGLFDINIEIVSPIGCETSRRFIDWISIDSLPVADFAYDDTLEYSNFNPTVVFTDQSIRAAGWDWTFGDFGSTILQNPTYTFPDTGLMAVELIVTHLYGCRDTIVKYVDIVPKITYFMPNAFTPNQDAKNELFMAGGIFRGIRDYDMKIINRWGEIIFESSDPTVGWNGRKSNTGHMSQNGVYVYMIRFTGPRGTPHQYKGFATLIR